MGKPSDRRGRRFRIGLLIIFHIYFLASALPAVPDQELLIAEPAEEFLTAGIPAEFSLFIPDVSPAAISFILPDMPAGVSVSGLSKDAYIPPAGDPNASGRSGTRPSAGTRIRFWITAQEDGSLVLPPVGLSVSGVQIQVPVRECVVIENIRLMRPALSVVFENGIVPDKNNTVSVSAGDPVLYTVYAVNAVRAVQYSWDIPENALFEEIRKYPFAAGEPAAGSFPERGEPVAVFKWMPLVPGSYGLPPVRLRVLSPAGKETDLAMPDMKIVVGEAVSARDGETIPGFLSAAFDNTRETDYGMTEPENISGDTAERIAALRIAERNSFPFSKAAAQRKEAEKSFGLPDMPNEHSGPLLYAMAAVCACAAVCLLLFVAFRRFKAARICGLALLALGGCTIWHLAAFYADAGILSGTTVYIIPEISAVKSVPVRAGIRVEIQSRIGEWMYIEGPDVKGWAPASSVIDLRANGKE